MAKRRKMRIGIFGGKFDPIHYGHLLCAEWSRQVYNLDFVLWVTSANPPNKPVGALDAEDRHEMVVAATADNPHFMASRIDLEHGGSGYSLMTVEAARQQFGQDAELYYMISSEYMDPEYRWYLPNWIGGKELFKICRFLVFPREMHTVEHISKWAAGMPQVSIDIAAVPSPDLSSTLIRDLCTAGQSIRYTTPIVVQQMIAKMGHYRGENTPAPKAEIALCDQDVRRIGIYGSQFDPIHYGHLLCAEWSRQRYELDRVIFTTSAAPPNNREAGISAEFRHEMTVSAVADNPYFMTSRVDLDRRTTSYALLTVEQFQKKYGQNVEMNWFVGSRYLDPSNANHLSQWMGASALFQVCRFLVIPETHEHRLLAKEWAKQIPDARIEVMSEAPLPCVSSELIRDLVREKKSIWYTTPWSVQQIINKHEIYRKKSRKSR
ncbi:MAG: nicotinate-nicotinamide nucleotide adenylyltransferase [Candidatus Obscuribacterales bacterium]|nr:nicotinate-nicotinamide nucleotide adenylyltransferase [Candidatus Obscuribacterales bacterium]